MLGVPRCTKQSIVAALRQRQASKLSLAVVNMPGGLLQAAAKQFGSYAKALDAAGLDYDKVRLHRWWTKESIVEEIRKLRAAGVAMSDKGIRSNSPALRGAIRSHFGSLAEAMEAAGVPYEGPQYLSKLEAFDRLKELQRRGADLSASAMKKRDERLYAALRATFGSYGRAIELLGLDYRQVSKRATWDKASVIAEFRRLAANGIEPRVSAIMKHAPRLAGAAVAQFGTFVKAIKAADIGYQPRALWTRKKVLEALMRLHRAGEDLSTASMRENHGGVHAAAVSRFGSYPKALAKAGFDLAKVRDAALLRKGRWSRELIIAALRKRRENGLELTPGKVPQLRDAARWHFGSYRQAVEAAGLPLESIKRGKWDTTRIVQRLASLHEEEKDLSPKQMRAAGLGGLLTAACRYMGSYRNAIEKAGLNYLEISRRAKWDKPAVVRKLQELAASGAKLGHRELRSSHPRIYQAALGAFGTYLQARLAAGVGPPPLTHWTEEKIIAELRKVASEGGNLAVSRLTRSRPALYDAAHVHFGSYDRALLAAGFDPSEIRLSRDWTRSSIVQELRALDLKDADLRHSKLAKLDAGLLQSTYHHFGSYELALKAAGVAYPPKKPLEGWAKSQVLRRLLQLHEEGEDLRYSFMKSKYSSLFFAARYYFDSYVGAVKKAGLDYDRIAKEQLTGPKRWRRAKSEQVIDEVAAHDA